MLCIAASAVILLSASTFYLFTFELEARDLPSPAERAAGGGFKVDVGLPAAEYARPHDARVLWWAFAGGPALPEVRRTWARGLTIVERPAELLIDALLSLAAEWTNTSKSWYAFVDGDKGTFYNPAALEASLAALSPTVPYVLAAMRNRSGSLHQHFRKHSLVGRAEVELELGAGLVFSAGALRQLAACPSGHRIEQCPGLKLLDTNRLVPLNLWACASGVAAMFLETGPCNPVGAWSFGAMKGLMADANAVPLPRFSVLKHIPSAARCPPLPSAPPRRGSGGAVMYWALGNGTGRLVGAAEANATGVEILAATSERAAWRLLANRTEAWFVRVASGTLVLRDRLEAFLAGLDARRPVVLGRRLQVPPRLPLACRAYVPVRGGYVLSAPALARAAECSLDAVYGAGGDPDLAAAACVDVEGGRIPDTRDLRGRERFFLGEENASDAAGNALLARLPYEASTDTSAGFIFGSPEIARWRPDFPA